MDLLNRGHDATNGQAFREDCGAGKHRSVRALFVLKERYLEAGLSEGDLLDFIDFPLAGERLRAESHLPA